MTIDAISSTGTTTTTTAGQGLQGSKDEFLKLFMAQLQQQDPFAPTSGADMVAQLAQLSSVEQAKQANTQLSDIAASQASSASAGLSSLIGRDCDANVGAFTLDTQGGAPPPIDISSTAGTKGAQVVITDADGKTIRTIPIADGTTSSTIAWDGKDDKGNPVPPGNYAMSVDQGASTSTISAQWHARVDAVELTASGPRLRMGDILLAPGDIRTIGATTSIPSPTSILTGAK